MQRSFSEEIMDRDGISPAEAEKVHRGLSLTHTLLGNHAAVLKELSRDGAAPRSVLDIGCGHGEFLRKVGGKFGPVELIGADLRPPLDGSSSDGGIRILKVDAVREPLPQAEVAVSICMTHHLDDEEFCELVRNVSRSCQRFIILDLVRHWLPLTFFRTFSPLILPRINVLDGSQSIRRSYTPPEFRALLSKALQGTKSTFEHRVAPFCARQIAHIRY